MFILFNKTIFELDEIVNQYLIYLTHIQQSVTLKVSDKINAFNYAEQIANEINALTGKLLSMQVNSFNQDDIFRFIDKNFYPIIRNLHAQITIFDKLLSPNLSDSALVEKNTSMWCNELENDTKTPRR